MAQSHAGLCVIVTGASSGIGKETARLLAERGAHVFAAMRVPDGKNARAASELAGAGLEAGGKCIPVPLELTDDRSVRACISEVIDREGKIDVLINCAGIMWRGPTEAFTTDQFDTVMQTNLYGPFRMIRAVLPHMRRNRSGLLISISSIAGRLVSPGSGIYAASKFALEALSESLRYELAPIGIDSIIVEPGPFRTNLSANGMAPEDAQVLQDYGFLEAIISRPRLIEYIRQHPEISTDPSDVARAISHLVASPAGQRPLRTTVGHDMGVAKINTDVAAHQRRYMEMLQLENLCQTAPDASASPE